MVIHSDWKTVEMPEQVERFMVEKDLTADELEYIREGHRPQEMEDKWFMYCENEKLFIHRSWTGYCIYIVDLSEKGRLSVTVNRNSEQYKEVSIESDRLLINILINNLIGENSNNAELMKRYIARKKGGSIEKH